jgi:aconitate hydratase
LVVSYALAGTVDIDLNNDPLGKDKNGQPVYLRELWPTDEEIQKVVTENVLPEMFQQKYADVFTGSDAWRAIQTSEGQLFEWDANSTYIQEPPFFQNLQAVQPISDIRGARVLALFGDSITTDHISPAGSIAVDSPAGKYLVAQGVQPRDFNAYGARRGNDQVLTRGTFANIRIKNRLTPGIEGGVTVYQGGKGSGSSGQALPIYDAAVMYQQAGVPTIVLAGKEYGTGSSRDWAAKGPNLLGVKAVIAESYERIHRSNLVGMGVLPLQFKPGQNADALGLTGHEVFDITGLSDNMPPQGEVSVTATKTDGSVARFTAIARLNTAVEVDYYRNGGVLNTVLKKVMA